MLVPALVATVDPVPGTVLTGTNTINGEGGTINGNESTGYLVSSGSLTINNATLSNFSTTGGTGSGGGAGLGGAVFVNSGATVILNNVNFDGNTVTGGLGGVGSTGGSLNNLFNGGTTVAQASSGYTPEQSTYTDIGGTTGTKGNNGTANANGVGGAGGNGGDGGDGGDRSISLILGVTTASVDLAEKIGAVAAAAGNPFTANVAIGLAPGVINAGINLGDAVAALAYFDKSLADGQIGLGGSGGVGGAGGTGGFGYGGGAGGDGGDGGTGGANWSGSAYNGGAAGGDAGDGGDGGIGGFGAGGGKGGDGGAGGGGAGFTASAGSPAEDAVYDTQVVPAVYSKGYDLNGVWVELEGNLTATFASYQLDHDNDPNTPDVLVEARETSPATEIQVLVTPAKAAIAATEGGQRPNGADGSGGSGGSGGFGAGAGSSGDGTTNGEGGEGGDGYGGAIFVRDGGTLIIQGDALFQRNAAAGGSSANGGLAGDGVGADLFMMKGSTVILDAGAGHTIAFNGGIADDSRASIADASNSIGQGAGLEVRSGLVLFNAANTYTGQTLITGGVLRAFDGVGLNRNSNLNFAGGVFETSGLFDRYVGTSGSRVQWTGSGGFSAYGGALTVTLNGGAQLNWNAGSFVTAGHTLLFGSEFSTDSVTFTNAINLGGLTGRIAVAANEANSNHAILTGAISNGALIVGDSTRTGVVILKGANTYAGGTTVNGGTLVLDGNGSLNAQSALTIANGATVDFSLIGDQGVGNLTGAGELFIGDNQLTINQDGISTFSGVIADGGLADGTGASVVKQGAGHLTLAGDNTYTGGTLVAAGTVTLTGTLASDAIDISAGATLNDVNGGLSGEATLANAGTINLGADETVASLTNSGTLNGAATLTAATYALDDGSVVNANLGAGAVTAEGIVALSGTSAAQSVTIASGTTTLGSAERLLDTADVTLDAGALLVLGGAEKIGTLNGAGNLDNHGGRLTVSGGSYSGVISGTGGLTKADTGTLELSGANTYTGSTLVEAGEVRLTGSIESDAVIVSLGATLESTAGGLAAHTVLTNHGTIELSADDTVASFTSTGTLNGTGTLTAATYALDDGSVINANLGAGILTTTGDVVLGGSSGALTVNVLGGSTLSLITAEVLNDAASVTVGGTLILNGGNETIRLLNGDGVVNVNTFLLFVTEGGAFTGTINAASTELISSGGNLDLSGTTTTEVTTVTNGGALNVNQGTLNSGEVHVNDGTLNVVDGTVTARSIQVGAGSALTLSGGYALSYDILAGAGVVDTAEFTNAGGSAVKGFLTFTGDFINNGTHAPGASPGVTTILGNYTESGVLEAELETTTPITGHDQIRVGGTVTLAAGSSLVVQSYNDVLPARGAVYQIISDLAGAPIAVSGTFGSVLFDADGSAGAGVAVANAAAVFDVATGQVITTGLNAADSTFAGLGADGNQGSAAQALVGAALVGQNQIDTTTAEGLLALQLIDASTGTAVLARYAPDYYGSLADYAFTGERALIRRVQDRVSAFATLPAGEAPAHGSAFAGYLSSDADTADNADVSRTDIFAGADYRLSSSLSVGVVVTRNDGDIHAPLGRAEVDGIGGLIYARKALNARFDVFGSLGYSSYDYDLRRTTLAGEVAASTDATSFSGNLGVQYAGWNVRGISIAPRLALTWSQVSVDGFTEAGAADALRNNGYDSTLVTVQAGVSAAWSTLIGGRAFSVEFTGAIEQALVDDNDKLNVTIAGTPSISYPISFADDEATRLTYGVNLGYALWKQGTVYAGYEGRTGEGNDNYINLGIRIGF